MGRSWCIVLQIPNSFVRFLRLRNGGTRDGLWVLLVLGNRVELFGRYVV